MCWTAGEEGGHSWTELLFSNSPTTACVPQSMESVMIQQAPENKTDFSLYIFLCVFLHHGFGSSSEPFDSLSLLSCSHFPFLPLARTPTVFCLSHPLFFSVYYIFISLSWESSPPLRWKRKGAGSRRPMGKHFISESKLSRGQRTQRELQPATRLRC